jgi:hypothetical protein
MVSSIPIRNLFNVSGNLTVIACDRPEDAVSWDNRKVHIVSNGGEKRQELTILGERSFLHKTANLNQIAIDTADSVRLSLEEAESGNWRIDLLP